MFAMFLTALYAVEGLETETLKSDLMQHWFYSSEYVTVDILLVLSSGRTTSSQ